MNNYLDTHEITFSEKNDMLEHLNAVEANSRYVSGVLTSDLTLAGIPNEPLCAIPVKADLLARYAMSEAALDTTIDADGSGLVLKYNGEALPVRNCAIPSISNLARLYGASLGLVPRETCASMFTAALGTARGKALLLECCGKISAIHGGDDADYAPLPINELFENTEKEIMNRFEYASFVSGSWAFDFTKAVWSLDNHKLDFQKRFPAIEDLFEKYHITVALTSSDTSNSAARISLALENSRGECVPFKDSVGTRHTNKATIGSFVNSFNQLTAKMDGCMYALQRMKNEHYHYACDVMVRALMAAKVNTSLIKKAVEAFVALYGENASLDGASIYIAACKCLQFAAAAGQSGAALAQLEQRICKITTMDMGEFDIPGDMAMVKSVA